MSKQEAPDFIVDLEGSKIGVELTEIFQDSNLGHSKLQEYSSVANSFAHELINLIQPHINYKFSLGLRLNKNIQIKKTNKLDILKKTMEICVSAMADISNHHHIELESYYDNLPEAIEAIHICHFDGLEESFNSKPEGGTIARLTINHIDPILKKKENKLSSYLQCDKQWLLIREGNYYAGSFSDVLIESPIVSLFDKVYLFRTQNKNIIELK